MFRLMMFCVLVVTCGEAFSQYQVCDSDGCVIVGGEVPTGVVSYHVRGPRGYRVFRSRPPRWNGRHYVTPVMPSGYTTVAINGVPVNPIDHGTVSVKTPCLVDTELKGGEASSGLSELESRVSALEDAMRELISLLRDGQSR